MNRDDNYNTARWTHGINTIETICDRLFIQQVFGFDPDAGGCRNHAYRGDPMGSDEQEVRCAIGCLMPLEEAKANPSGAVDILSDGLMGIIHDGVEGVARWHDIPRESRVAFRSFLRSVQEYHDDSALHSTRQDEFLHLAGWILTLKRTARFLKDEWGVFTDPSDFSATLKHAIGADQHHRIDAIINTFLAYAEKR